MGFPDQACPALDAESGIYWVLILGIQNGFPPIRQAHGLEPFGLELMAERQSRKAPLE